MYASFLPFLLSGLERVLASAVSLEPGAPLANSLCGVGVDCTALIGKLLILGLANGAALALIATGITLMYSTVRILNLAHGDVFALTTVLTATLINQLGIQPTWSPLQTTLGLSAVCLAAVGFGALLSMGIERVAFRPFGGGSPGASKTAPLIASLGISFILFQVALVWRTFQVSWIPGEHRSVPGLPEVPTDRIPDLLPAFDVLPRLGLNLPFSLRLNDLFMILVALVFAVGVSLYLKHTRTGRSLRAYAQNPLLAQVVGVNEIQTARLVFALGGGLAGAAAFIFTLYYARPFGDHGAQSGLLAFAAALLGGVGSPLGALFSGLMLGVFSAFSDYFLNAAWTPILLLAALIGLLALYPGGLGGDKTEPNEAAPGSASPAGGVLDRWLPAKHKFRQQIKRWLNWKIGLLLALVYPLFAEASQLGGQLILSTIAIFAILALGLNLSLGLAGVLDLGIAASFAAGAYAAARAAGLQLDFGLVLLFGAGLGGLVGLVKGLLARRLPNNALAAATLALGLLAQKLIILARPLTGGSGGIGAIPAPRLLGFPLASASARYYLALALLAGAVVIYQRLAGSRLGRAWQAASADAEAAQSSGVDTAAVRQLALLLSGLLAGAAGALQVMVLSYVDPSTAAFHISVMALAIVILGQTGSLSPTGVLVGALLIIGYDKVLIPQLGALLALVWPRGLNIGPVPDLRGASFFNFGLALYLTILLRQARKR